MIGDIMRAHDAHARLQRAASVRLGRLRPAGRERGDQEQDASRDVDAREHRPHEGAAAAARASATPGSARSRPACRSTTGGTSGCSRGCSRRGWPTAAGRTSTGARAVRRCWPTSRSSTAAAGAAAPPVTVRDLEQWFLRITAYADELLDALPDLTDWPEKVLTMQRNWIGRSEGARVRFPIADGLTATPEVDRGLHDAHRHDLRRELRAARARASAGRALRGRVARPGGVSREGVARFRAQDRTARMTGEVEKEGFDTGRSRDQPVHACAGAGVGGELRPGRVRHRRGDGRAGARPARLRVRAQVRTAGHGRRPARGADARRRRRSRPPTRTPARWWTPGRLRGLRLGRGAARR